MNKRHFKNKSSTSKKISLIVEMFLITKKSNVMSMFLALGFIEFAKLQLHFVVFLIMSNSL